MASDDASPGNIKVSFFFLGIVSLQHMSRMVYWGLQEIVVCFFFLLINVLWVRTGVTS